MKGRCTGICKAGLICFSVTLGLATGQQGNEIVLPLAPSGWPETRHRWANPKEPYSEVYFLPLVLRQVGKTKQELWAELMKFPFGNPEVTYNGDWAFGGKESKSKLTLRYEFGFEDGRVDRIYVAYQGNTNYSLLAAESFSWPKQISAYTNDWHINALRNRFEAAKPERINSGGWPETRLSYILEAKLPNNSTMRHLAFAGDAANRWITFKEEFDPAASRTKFTWAWMKPLKRASDTGTSAIFVASNEYWKRAEKVERDLPWHVRSFEFMSGSVKYPLPIKVVAK